MIIARMAAGKTDGTVAEIIWVAEQPGEQPRAFELGPDGGRIPIEIGPLSDWWELAERVAPADAAGGGRCN